MNKPIVHYKDVITPVAVGRSAVVWPINHPSPLVTNSGPVLTSPVVTVTAGSRGPLFETANTYYKPHDDNPLPVVPDAEYVGFGAFREGLREQADRVPEVMR